MNDYYMGFIETCIGFGMDKEAADILYKQAAGVRELIGIASKAMKGGKGLTQAMFKGKPFTPEQIAKVQRFLGNSKKIEQFGKQYFANEAELARMKEFFGMGNPVAAKAKAVVAPAAARVKVPTRPSRVNLNEALAANGKKVLPAAAAPAAAGRPTRVALPPTGPVATGQTATRINYDKAVRQAALSQMASGNPTAGVLRGDVGLGAVGGGAAAAPGSAVAEAQKIMAKTKSVPKNRTTKLQRISGGAPAVGGGGAAPGVADAAVADMAAGGGGIGGWMGRNPLLTAGLIGVPAYMAGRMTNNS